MKMKLLLIPLFLVLVLHFARKHQAQGLPEDTLSCLSHFKDSAALATLTVLVELPMIRVPSLALSPVTGQQGHAFIQFRVLNKKDSACECIGFYPSMQTGNVPFIRPVPGVLLDDGLHGWDAALEMPITVQQLDTALTLVRHWAAQVAYQPGRTNDISFALAVLNRFRGRDSLSLSGKAPSASALFHSLQELHAKPPFQTDRISISRGKRYTNRSYCTRSALHGQLFIL
jgi:hypothetical protein